VKDGRPEKSKPTGTSFLYIEGNMVIFYGKFNFSFVTTKQPRKRRGREMAN
jgi:hypothetical protein